MAIDLHYDTTLYARPDSEVVVRTSVDGWDRDLGGTYSAGSWIFHLAGPQYAAGFEFKFLLVEPRAWCAGPNLVAPANSSGPLQFDDSEIGFPFFINFAPHDSAGFWADAGFTLRTSAEGWDTDIPARPAVPLVWALEWGRYSNGAEFKFLAHPPSASEPVWMMNDNLVLTPLPDTTSYFAGEHGGPIVFPFFVRFVTNKYAEARITWRDQADGWVDRVGAYQDGAWVFSIPFTDYFDSAGSGPAPLAGKFLLDGEWMLGPDIRIGPAEPWEPGAYVQVGATYSFDESQVQFR